MLSQLKILAQGFRPIKKENPKSSLAQPSIPEDFYKFRHCRPVIRAGKEYLLVIFKDKTGKEHFRNVKPENIFQLLRKYNIKI